MESGKKECSRSANFTPSEIEVLVELATRHSNVLTKSFNSFITHDLKKKIWESITKSVNEKGGFGRTWLQIRKKWKDLTQKAVQTQRQINKARKVTGGPPPSQQLTELQQELLSKVPKSKFHGVGAGGFEIGGDHTYVSSVWDNASRTAYQLEDENDHSDDVDEPEPVPQAPKRVVNMSLPTTSQKATIIRVVPKSNQIPPPFPPPSSTNTTEKEEVPKEKAPQKQNPPQKQNLPQKQNAPQGQKPYSKPRSAATSSNATSQTQTKTQARLAASGARPEDQSYSAEPRNINRRKQRQINKEEKKKREKIYEEKVLEEMRRQSGIMRKTMRENAKFHNQSLRLKVRNIKVARRRIQLEQERRRRDEAVETLLREQLAVLQRVNETADLTAQFIVKMNEEHQENKVKGPED